MAKQKKKHILFFKFIFKLFLIANSFVLRFCFDFYFPIHSRMFSLGHWVGHGRTLRSLAILTSLPPVIRNRFVLSAGSQAFASVFGFFPPVCLLVVTPGLTSAQQRTSTGPPIGVCLQDPQGSLLGLGNTFHLPTS